jgi:hypothetical protein
MRGERRRSAPILAASGAGSECEIAMALPSTQSQRMENAGGKRWGENAGGKSLGENR